MKKKIRKFRFIGTEKQALDYVHDPQNAPVNGEIYDGDKIFGSWTTVTDFATGKDQLALEWEEIKAL
jgi:hypothetical protein